MFSTSTKENTTESISHITYTEGENNGPTSYPEYDTYEKGTFGSPCSLKDVIEYTASHGKFDDVTDLFYFYAYIESFTQLDEYHYDITIYVDEGELFKVDLKNVYVGPTSYIPYVAPPEVGAKAAFTGRVGLFYDSEIGFYDDKFVSSELSIYTYFNDETKIVPIEYYIGDFYTYSVHYSTGVVGQTITLQFKCKDDFVVRDVYNDNQKEKVFLEYSVENKILTVILTVEEINNIYIDYDLVYNVDFGTNENPITIAEAMFSFDGSEYMQRQKWTIIGEVEELAFGGEKDIYYTTIKLVAGAGVERLCITHNIYSPLNICVGDVIVVSCDISRRDNDVIYCDEWASIVRIDQETTYTTLEAMANSQFLKEKYIKITGCVTSIKSDTEITIKSDNPEITIKSSSLEKYKDQFAVGEKIVVTGQFVWDSPYSIVDYGKKPVEIISIEKNVPLNTGTLEEPISIETAKLVYYRYPETRTNMWYIKGIVIEAPWAGFSYSTIKLKDSLNDENCLYTGCAYSSIENKILAGDTITLHCYIRSIQNGNLDVEGATSTAPTVKRIDDMKVYSCTELQQLASDCISGAYKGSREIRVYGNVKSISENNITVYDSTYEVVATVDSVPSTLKTNDEVVIIGYLITSNVSMKHFAPYACNVVQSSSNEN